MRLLVALIATAVWGQSSKNEAVPRTWDVERLASYELPLAIRSVTPVHISPQRYYAIPVEKIYRTYPRHSPGKTDEEYFAWLRQQEPEIISAEPGRVLTKEEWVRIGQAVFEWPATITPVERLIGPTTRLVIREKGKIEFGNAACYGCHARYLSDGTVIPGAQVNIQLVWAARQSNSQAPAATTRPRQTNEWATPWFTPDPNAVPDDMPAATFTQLFVRSPNQAPRGGTSPFAPAKVPDLIGIADRKYLDHTGLGQHRDIGDLMRYAALNFGTGMRPIAHLSSYGGFVPNSGSDAAAPTRISDEHLYALAQYVYSLRAPKSPHPMDARARRGERIFTAQGCNVCHPAPLYTNNKLTPADGYDVPEEDARKYDVLPIRVGTDPWLAMKTRRGTGYYKVPSLKGVWYRGPFEHNGSVLNLEDWFDPARLRDDYEPTGWAGPLRNRAVKGHRFGLDLAVEDRAALIAFLKTL